MPAKPFLVPAMKKAMAEFSVKDAISKSLREMTTADMAAYFTKATSTMFVPTAWPYGTVVRSKGLAALESHRVMVVVDNGHSFTGLLLTGTVDTPTGTRIDTLHDNWEPDTP